MKIQNLFWPIQSIRRHVRRMVSDDYLLSCAGRANDATGLLHVAILVHGVQGLLVKRSTATVCMVLYKVYDEIVILWRMYGG
jgi:hypothetical protein